MMPHHLAHAALQPIQVSKSESADDRLTRWPGRGLLAGMIALGMGALILATSGGRITAGDLVVLGLLLVGALVGGSVAQRMAARRLVPAWPGDWLTVIITTQRPTSPEVSAKRPPSRPRSGPERRSLERLHQSRHRLPVTTSCR